MLPKGRHGNFVFRCRQSLLARLGSSDLFHEDNNPTRVWGIFEGADDFLDELSGSVRGKTEKCFCRRAETATTITCDDRG